MSAACASFFVRNERFDWRRRPPSCQVAWATHDVAPEGVSRRYTVPLATTKPYQSVTTALPRAVRRESGRAATAIYQDLFSAPGRIRTCDARFRKPMLYPLSYGSGAPQID